MRAAVLLAFPFIHALAASSGSCGTTVGQDCLGNDIKSLENSSPDACCNACTSTANCGAFVYVSGGMWDKSCYLKTSCVPVTGCSSGTCIAGNVSPSPSPAPGPTPTPSGVSYRVAKALGSRGYDMVRISKVDIGPFPDGLRSPQASVGGVAWSYSSQFVHRWTNMHLNSAVVSVQAGTSTTLDVDGALLQVRIPAQGAGTMGLLIADPCIIQSVWCPYADVYDIENTLQSVLNSMAAHNELDYWMNIGDLFYDQIGNITTRFFSGLSEQVQSTVHGVSMGNHDYWNDGSPGTAVSTDNFGNGLMQWYAQDAISAKFNPAAPFDFSQSPDLFQVADYSNFFWYYMLGNVAFISYTGAASWSDQYSYFAEACSWADSQNPALVVLMGHWDADNLGCRSGMAAPEVYSKILSVPGCSALSSRIKYFEGHNHCNRVTKTNVGFMIGAFGMGGCGDFGLPVLDTRNGEAKLWYFSLGSGGVRHSNWDTVLGCIKANGVSSCTQYASLWMQQSLSYEALNV